MSQPAPTDPQTTDPKPKVASIEPGWANYKIGQTQCIVTSGEVTLIQGITGQPGYLPMPQDRDLVLLADHVTITGWLTAPGRNVTIIARTIGTALDTLPVTPQHPGQRAAIDSSGPPGMTGLDGVTDALPQSDATGTLADGTGNNGNTGKAGQNGLAGVDGGNITILCNSTESGFDLTLRSRGGDGGSGQDGQRGGNGAQGRKGDDEPPGQATAGHRGGDGGPGGKGGDAGYGGKGGGLLFHALDPRASLAQSQPYWLSSGIPGSRFGQGGMGGTGGPGGAGGSYPGLQPGYKGHMPAGPAGGPTTVTKAPNGVFTPVPAGRRAGWRSIQNIAVHNTPYGFDDTDYPSPGITASFKNLDWTNIDLLSYLEMELEQAGYDYLALPIPVDQALTDSSVAPTIATARSRLEWVLNLAYSVDAAKIAAPLGKDAGATVAPRLANIIQRADALFGQIGNGQDYFGHDPSWVPTLSLSYYEQQLGLDVDRLDGAVQVYADAQTRYAKLQAAFETGADDTETRRAVQSQAADGLTALSTKISDLQDSRATLLARIKDQGDKLPGLRTALLHAVDDWKKITALTGAFLSAEKVFESVGQFAFFPEEGAAMLGLKQAAMVAGTGGSVLSSLTTPDPGTEYVLGGLRVLEDTVGSLQTSFTTLSGGWINVDDFNGQLLLTSQQNFDQLCDQNWSKPAGDAKLAMDEYVEGVQNRNRSILEYNQTLTALTAALADQATLTRLSQMNTSDQLAAANQSLAESAVQASMTLTAAREECLRLVYEASRALSLATFQPDLSFYSTLGLAAPTTITADGAKTAAVSLVTKRRALLDSHMPQQHLPSETGGIDEQFGRAGGVSWTVNKADAPEFFAKLAGGDAMLVLDPYPLCIDPNGPFAGMRNVRVRGIRFWIHGYKARNPQGVVHVQFTHTGDSSFVVDKIGNVDTRHHDPVTRDFRYLAAKADDYQAIYDKELGNVQDGILIDETNTHALLSPFATWRLTLPSVPQPPPAGTGTPGTTSPDPNQDDASQLTAVHIEFFIDYDPSS